MTKAAGALSEQASKEPGTELRVRVDAQATGMTIRKGLAGQTLTAVITYSVQFDFYAQSNGKTRITRSSPFLEGVDASHLDKDGIVRIGTIVTANLIAISAVSPLTSSIASRETNLLAAILGNDEEQQVRNSSEYFSVEHIGCTVAAVNRENIRDLPKRFEPGLIDRVTISLVRHDALAVGDFVANDGRSIAVVDVLDDESMPTDENQQAIDAIVPANGATVAVDQSIQKMIARRQKPSVRDTVEARSVGPYSLITLMPLKGHGFRGQIVTAMEIRWLLENRFVAIATELASLKCDDTFNRDKLRALDEGNQCFPLTTEMGAPESLFVVTEELRLLGLRVEIESRENCVALRVAPATRDWLLGVASQTIRKPETINYRTYRPEKGGLFCEQVFGPETHVRRQRAAHFELAAPVVPILFRIGEQPILCRLLGLEPDVIESIVSWRSGVTQRFDVVPIDHPDCVLKGAEAIEKLLQEHGKEVPFDLRSLIQNDVYVIPPDYRPLVLLDSGNFATSDLNDLYRRVINRSNRLRKLRELNAPPGIIDNEIRELQLCVDQLQANGWKSSPTMGRSDRPLLSGLDLVLPRICGEETKRVDWSASARAIVDNLTTKGQCTLPQTVFNCLRCNVDEPVLLTGGKSFVACKPILGQDLVIRMHSDTAAMLNLSEGATCIVHRPITSDAVDEANRMSTMTDAKRVANVSALEAGEQLNTLLSHVMTGEPIVWDSPHHFLLGGAGSLQRRQDNESPLPVEEDIRVTIRSAVPLPSLSELREVVESTERVSCVFRIFPTGHEPLPQQGRIGGRPWLPAGTEWPRTRDGRSVPFFAQLPISPMLNDSLPFQVDSEMLLTLFWSDDWWEAEATTAPYVFMHSTNELQLFQMPQELTARPRCRIETHFKKQLPSWPEIRQILRCHFDKVPNELLTVLKNEVDDDKRQVLEESRIGGRGYWVQNAFDDFVAQFVEDEQAGFSFGDAGSLYIFGHSPNELAAAVQSH